MRRTLCSLILVLTACGDVGPVSSHPPGPGPRDAGTSEPGTSQPPSHPAARAQDFVDSIGANAHLSTAGSPYTRDGYAFINPLLVSSGIRNLRTPLSPDPDVVAEHAWLASQGFRFLLKPTGSRFTGAQLATATAKEVAPVRYFEGVNEPNLQQDFPDSGTPWWQDTRDYQAEIDAAFKANPQTRAIPVLAAPLGYLSDHQFATDYGLLGNLSGAADVASVHSYPYLSSATPSQLGLPSMGLQKVPLAQAAVPGAPVVSSETGYNTAVTPRASGQLGVSERAQDKYVPRLLMEQFNAGIRTTYLYEFIDDDTSDSNYESHFGLLHSDGSPKPVFVTLQHLIALLTDGDSHASDFAPGDLHYRLEAPETVHSALFQKADGEFVLALWNEVQSYSYGTPRNQGQDVESSVSVSLTVGDARGCAAVFLPERGTSSVQAVAAPQSLTLTVADRVSLVVFSPTGSPCR